MWRLRLPHRSFDRYRSALMTAIVASLVASCSSTRAPVVEGPTAAPPSIHLHEVTAEAGLEGTHYPAHISSAKIIATMGGGIAWGDIDFDGDEDLFVTQGIPKQAEESGKEVCGLLFLNDGKGHFEESARRLGIRACGWGSGSFFEDVNGDGNLDLLVTLVGENQLWINNGDGSFENVAEEAGITAEGYNVGAAWLDFDRDGLLDLYLARYVDTTVEIERTRRDMNLVMPEDYEAPPNLLFRNNGDGTFADVTSEAGVVDNQGRGLTVIAADLDCDDWVDLYVANDRGRNTYFRNLGDGTFEDETMLSGAGVGLHGQWESAMGLAMGDVDGNGYPDLLVTNYVNEPNTLFLNEEGLLFQDRTRPYGLYEAPYEWVGWGAEFVDFDNDGFLDLYVANGHIIPTWIAKLGGIGLSGEREKLVDAYAQGGYQQPLLVYHGRNGSSFELVENFSGQGPFRRMAARGASTADIDRDGRLDLFVLSLPKKSPSALFLNQTKDSGHWIELDLRTGSSGANTIGSRIVVRAQSRLQHHQVMSGGSYLSSSATPAHIGLGEAEHGDVEITRPDASRARYLELRADRRYSFPPRRG